MSKIGVSIPGTTHNISLGGYTCPNCNGWVPNGWTHACSNAWPNPTPPQPVSVDPYFAYARIADALERIAEALERLTEEES